MRRIIGLFILFCSVVIVAIYLGSHKPMAVQKQKSEISVKTTIPSIGRVEVLNGCGTSGAANEVASFLRDNGIDVKAVDNAHYWNYPYTIIASRIKDMHIAEQIAAILKTDKVIMLRTSNDLYDVTVFIGSDYGELIQ